MSNINTESIEKVFNNNFNPLEDKINELHKAITTKELSKYTFLDEPSEILHQGIGETILYDGKEVGGIFKSGISKEGDVFIFNIETFKGHGRNVIRKIFEDKKVKTIYGEATDESIGFWKKMGAVFGNYIEAAYTTEFTITRENFERLNPLENKINKMSQLTANDIFDITTTGMSLYDELLKECILGKYKPVKSFRFDRKILPKIECMSPEQYLVKCYEIHKYSYDFSMQGKIFDDYLRENINIDLIKNYKERVLDGSKMPIPVLDYDNMLQNGRHRAVVAKELGVEEIPVLVVKTYEE